MAYGFEDETPICISVFLALAIRVFSTLTRTIKGAIGSARGAQTG